MRAPLTLNAVRTIARVEVDPNQVSRVDPRLTAVAFEDADRVPRPGETVVAVQSDADGGEFVSKGRVERVDPDHGLIFVAVDWDRFSYVPAPALQTNSVTVLTHLHTHVNRVMRPLAGFGNVGAGRAGVKLT